MASAKRLSTHFVPHVQMPRSHCPGGLQTSPLPQLSCVMAGQAFASLLLRNTHNVTQSSRLRWENVSANCVCSSSQTRTILLLIKEF